MRTILGFACALMLAVLTNTAIAQPSLRLAPNGLRSDARFGEALALDGSRLAVGAPGSGSDAGTVIVYRRSGPRWVEETRLVASDTAPGDRFGSTVAISGEHLLIGAPGVDSDGDENTGAAYFFRRQGMVWTEVARVAPGELGPRDDFGAHLTIEGELALVGVPELDKVFVYRFDGSDWIEGDPVVSKASGIDFGGTVALSDSWAVVGASRAPVAQRVHLFRRGKGDAFTFETAVGGEPQRAVELGMILAIDGDRVAASARNLDGPELVYTYVLVEGAWTTESVQEIADGNESGLATLALAPDYLMMGLPDKPTFDAYGEARLLEPVGGSWIVDAIPAAPPAQQEDARLGQALALSPPLAIVGAPGEIRRQAGSDDPERLGAVYVFLASPCRVGAVDAANGSVADVLFVNDSFQTGERHVEVDSGGAISAGMLAAPAVKNGRFVVHVNAGLPDPTTITRLPKQVGRACFPLLLSNGADPIAIWNGLGKESSIGSSRGFDGSPIENPDPAPTIFLSLPTGDPTALPPGTIVTFQGVLEDPSSLSTRGVSVTNAVTVRFR